VLFANAPTLPFLVAGILFVMMLFPALVLARRAQIPAAVAA
jgi:hypothetical protein